MDMSKVNMHKRMAMTGKASDVPAKAGHFRGGGIAKRGKGKALQDGGAFVANMAKQGVGQALQLQEGGVFSDTIGRALGRRTPDAEGRALPRPKGRGKTRRGKKGQGYKAREDESLGMRRGKESGKRQSMRDRRDESYGKWRKPPQLRKGKKERRADYRKEVQKKGGNVIFADEWDKIDPGLLTGLGLKKGGAARRNTRRENILEEEGRVSAEKAYTKGGKRRLGAEKRRLVRELKK